MPDALPRPGQLDLVDDMSAAADVGNGHVAAIAPTGVGKSFAALATAAVAAVDYEQRWVISTESISLQQQYVEQDGPVIRDAAAEVLGRPVDIQVLKGWSNYTCALKARDSAQQMGIAIPPTEGSIVNVAERVKRAKLPKSVEIDGWPRASSRVQPLVAWALAQHGDEELPGDRSSYAGEADDREWATVSVSTQECLGESQCPLAVICKPLASRERVAQADIVVTNHAMLAVQASTGSPVVIGSQKVGPISGIIVDEAHALPSIVRNQGQSAVSGRRIATLSRSVTKLLPASDTRGQKWESDGRALVDYVDEEITASIGAAIAAEAASGNRNAGRGGGAMKIPTDADPLAQSGDVLTEWLRKGSKLLQEGPAKGRDVTDMIRAKRAIGDIDKFVRDVDSVRQHWVGTARWLEPAMQQTALERQQSRSWASVQSAPVAVGRMIERNLWTEITKDEDENEVVRELTVVCLSATMPQGFVRDASLRTIAKDYASPFDAAYAESMLFVPRAVEAADVEALRRPWGSKPAFDTGRHPEWAITQMLPLVAANRGSALVLSASKANGIRYAEALRADARGRWRVYSQWDGGDTRLTVQRWRDDHNSVLVGTRSLMTGVNAPGETNTLVIVDRPPRASGNPVDDARVEMLAEALSGDRWAADRLVYVADAASLLEQAAGRLIRSMADSGMVAVLDPRLLNKGPFSQPEATRKTYMNAVRRFERKTSDMAQAIHFLTERRALAAQPR